jgi:hypothetical protein
MSDTTQDAPTGPAGTTSPGGPTTPGGPGGPGPEPEVHPSSPPDGPATIPPPETQPAPGPTGEIHARSQTEQANEELQEENAETSLDQPSDGSGGE